MPNWFIVRNGAEQEPLSSEQLRNLVITGQVRPDDMVRREDISKPIRAGSVQGLFGTSATAPKLPEPPRVHVETPLPASASTAKPRQPVIPSLQATTSSASPPTKAAVDFERVKKTVYHPALIAPALLCCFPAGLALVWTHPRWTILVKSLWTGGYFSCFFVFAVVGVIGSKQAKDGVEAGNKVSDTGDREKGALSATGSDVLTAEFYPFKPGHKYQTGGDLDYMGVHFQREYSHHAGGIIQRKWLKMYTNDNPKLPVPSGTTQQHYRLQDGYIEIGDEVEGQKTIKWSPIVKIGAKAGDTWNRQVFEGQHESFKLVEFATREVANKGFIAGDKVFCAVIEKTATISTPKQPMVFVEEIVLARGIGPFRHSSWRMESGERERNWWERWTPTIKK